MLFKNFNRHLKMLFVYIWNFHEIKTKIIDITDLANVKEITDVERAKKKLR